MPEFVEDLVDDRRPTPEGRIGRHFLASSAGLPWKVSEADTRRVQATGIGDAPLPDEPAEMLGAVPARH
jgi:hypothetical protein